MTDQTGDTWPQTWGIGATYPLPTLSQNNGNTFDQSGKGAS